ncbi:sphingomyelin synthase 2, putative [Plasmodium ovale]|uniref:Sphingomyelin synthase 2, putative n=1 Tax=Plasmodium ovale TaxID=36330 RepID=A0A1C3KU76_PLAOA|nr:sphingomyelin synthase 2, putative [Plasmodium ovale]
MKISEFDKKHEQGPVESDGGQDNIISDNYQINMDKKVSHVSVLRKDAQNGPQSGLQKGPQNEALNDTTDLTQRKLLKILLVKLNFALLFLIISLLIQGFFMIYSDSYYKTYTTPLLDRVHELFQYPPKWVSYKLSNTLIAILTVSFLHLILFNSIYLSIPIICRFLYMLGFFYIVRGILIYVTSIPATLKTCIPLECGNLAFNLLQIVKINLNMVYVCSDLIISGHSFSTTIFLLFSLCYMNNIVLKTIVALFCCVIYAFIIIGFIHYTSDVLLGFLFGIFIFSFYHIMLDLSSQYYIFSKLFEIKIISNKKNVQAKPFFLRLSLVRIFLNIIPLLEGLNYTLDYAINKNSDKSTFCNCEKNSDCDDIPLCSFRKSQTEKKISLTYSDHLFHTYAGDGTFNFLLFKFLRRHKVE